MKKMEQKHKKLPLINVDKNPKSPEFSFYQLFTIANGE